jgi:uncharacterized repeat protein (TIGR03803 family)
MRTGNRPSSRKCAPARCMYLVLFCSVLTTCSLAQTLTTLVSFNNLNGFEPVTPVVQGFDGNLYGTTQTGGNLETCGGSGCGTIFTVTPTGTLTTLVEFNGSDGEAPTALVQGSDGDLYGTTFCSTSSIHRTLSTITATTLCDGPGSVFKISSSGGLAMLNLFSGPDGSAPNGGFVQGNDGNFYGTAEAGGTNDDGTVFKITPGGMLTTLYSFSGPDGQGPIGLIQGSDGNFYGTTFDGGANSQGTIYKITPSGVLTTLYSFAGPDGAQPTGLVQGTDGNFYGTTLNGGTGNCNPATCGTVFQVTPQGALTVLHNFNFSDGQGPNAVVQATDGNFYGTTRLGGQGGYGTAFRITPTGSLTTLHSFCTESNCSDGGSPFSGLTQGASGLLYGTTGLGGNFGYGTVFSLSGVSPSPSQFVPSAPCRLLDTRGGSPIQGGTWQTIVVPQLGKCNIPAGATAYSLNVTAVPRGPLGYLTIWPAGQPQPYISAMNSSDGRTKANAAIVAAGASGAVSVYVTNTTDIILDIGGYFQPAREGSLQFYPLAPCRLVDTRGADGDLGGPYLHAQTEREFPVLESSCLSGVQGAEAYSMNFTVVPHPAGQPLEYLTVWPAGETQPTVSTLNNPTATVVANAAIVPAGTNGSIAVWPYNTTDLIVDINGYFAAPGQTGYNLYPVAPCRAYDSRSNNGQPFSGERTVNIVGSPCAPSANAGGYVFNATVVPSPTLGYLTLWADGQTRPIASTLNAYDGFVTSNMAIVQNTDGSTDAYAGGGAAQLILDISGYFAP